MKKSVAGPSVAEVEIDRIIEYWEVDPEGDEWEASRKRLLFAIQKGRITLDEEHRCVKMKLVLPIAKEDGTEIEVLDFHEPSANDLTVMDKYKKDALMAKTIHLASRMTRVPVGIIERMTSRDVSTMGAITSLFF